MQYSGQYGYFLRHFAFQGRTYLANGYHYWKAFGYAGAIFYTPARSFPLGTVDVAADGSGIYAAAWDGGLLMSSTDSNFTAYTAGLPIDTVLFPGGMNLHIYTTAVALNQQFVFLGTHHGVYRATKGSWMFSAMNNGLPPHHVQSLFCKDTLLVACVDSLLFRSTDAGNTWAMASTPYVGNCVRIQQFGDSLYASYYHGGLYVSGDDGLTWSLIHPSLQAEHIVGVAQLGSDLFMGGDQGYFLGPSPVEARKYNGCKTGIVSMTKTDSCVFATTSSDVFVTSDQGLHWDNVTTANPLQPAPAILSLGGQVLWGGGQSSGTPLSLFLSHDCAMTWDTLQFPGTSWLTYLSGDGHQAMVNIDLTHYWLLSDSGATLAPIQRPGFSDCSDDPVLLLVDGAVYATSCVSASLLRSDDLGQTWRFVGNGLPSDNVCYMERLGGRLFATFEDDIYQAVSGDSLWIPSKLGIPGHSGPFFDMEWDGNQYYVCNGKKVWASLNGMHWTDVSQGLPTSLTLGWVYSGMALHDSILYLGTWGRGVWKRPVADVSVSLAQEVSPSQALRIFPNPVHDRLYWTGHLEFVQVMCVDAVGHPVSVQQKANGLDVSGLAQGMYVVVATTRKGAVLRGKFWKL